MSETRFWHFDQNNTGGSFDLDEAAGITHNVVVEASDMAHAIARAEEIGLYWNGVDDGRDCECCGDRWSIPWTDEGDAEPKVYGQPVASAMAWSAWMPEGKETCVHYLDGRKEWHGVTKEPFRAAHTQNDAPMARGE